MAEVVQFPAPEAKEELHCIGCIPDYWRSDGVEFKRGDWVQIDKGIGRFMGVWDNPMLGLTSGLSCYRTFAEPAERSSVYFCLGKIGGTVERCALDSACKVSGPMKSNGKRPTAAIRKFGNAG